MDGDFRTAYVYVRNIYAGKLSETDNGYEFKYDDGYIENKDASPVSFIDITHKERNIYIKGAVSFF